MDIRRKRATRTIALSGLVAASLLAAGCSPFAGGTPKPEGSTELTLMLFDGGEDNKWLEEMIDGFEAVNPGITIATTFIPEETYATKLQTALLAEPPDLAWPYGWDLMFQFNTLDELVLDKHDVSLDSLSSVVSQGCQWDGKLYCVGTNIGSMVTFYNKALFDAKGIEYPSSTVPMTFQEMADLAARLNSPDDGVFGAGTNLLVAYLDQAVYLDDTGRKIDITGNDFEETARITTGMVVDGVAPSGGQMETMGGTGEAMFLSGNIAMYITDSFLIDSIEQEGIGYGVAPTPIVPGHEPWIVSWTNALGIPKGAKHPEEAAKFLAYLVTDGQKIQAKYGAMPTNIEAAQAWANTPERKQLFEVNSLIRLATVTEPNRWAWNGPIIDALGAAESGEALAPLLQDAEPKAQQGLDTTWEQFDKSLAAAGLSQ